MYTSSVNWIECEWKAIWKRYKKNYGRCYTWHIKNEIDKTSKSKTRKKKNKKVLKSDCNIKKISKDKKKFQVSINKRNFQICSHLKNTLSANTSKWMLLFLRCWEEAILVIINHLLIHFCIFPIHLTKILFLYANVEDFQPWLIFMNLFNQPFAIFYVTTLKICIKSFFCRISLKLFFFKL